jgi:Family of unknown function (DUF5677)
MSSAIFTPDNEPYLGLKSLLVFDQLICSCLELNSQCATASHRVNLSDFQKALCILAPQTISLALSIRELIRQGYLFGAKVLLRPFVERSVTMLYLFHNEEGLKIWNDGWNYNKRPKLPQMFENLNEKLLGGAYPSVKGFTADFNSATHGDPLSARWNIVVRDHVPVFLPSKNVESPQLADEICAETIPWLASTMGMMSAGFPELKARSADSVIH